MAMRDQTAAGVAAAPDWGADLHPVLRRVYAARGVARDEDLDLSLERLLPVTSLEGVWRRRACWRATSAAAACW